MFTSPPELSPDLEWMLQSGQASYEQLAEILVRTCYPELMRLACLLLDDPKLAARVLRRALAQAVLQAYSYSGQESVMVWLYRLVLVEYRETKARAQLKRSLRVLIGQRDGLGESQPATQGEAEIWLALDSLPDRRQTIALLYFGLSWTPQDIGALFRLKTSQIQAELEQARRRVLKKLQAAGEDPPGELDRSIRLALNRRWSILELTEEQFKDDIQAILATASRRGTRQANSFAVKEFVLTTIGILLVVLILWSSYRWLPEETPAQAPAVTIIHKRVLVTRLAEPVVVTPTLPASRTPYPISGGRAYTVQPGDTLESLAAAAGLSPQALANLNRLQPGAKLRPGQALIFPVDSLSQPIDTPTPVSTLPGLAPLTVASSEKEIQGRMFRSQSLWNTLFAQARLIYYGPSSYAGPPKGYLVQAWVSRPRQSLEIDRSLDGTPARAFRVSGNARLALDLADRKLSIPGDFGNGLLHSPELTEMLLTIHAAYTQAEGRLQVTGAGEQAGRPALVADWLDPAGGPLARIWIDMQTGTVLREIRYSGDDHQTVISDFAIQQLDFDRDFPAGIFDLTLPGWDQAVESFSGLSPYVPAPAPELANLPSHAAPIPRLSPPDLDPSSRALVFQFPDTFDPGKALQPDVNVFAGGFYLGKATLGNPWTMICQRSPDGTSLAFVGDPASADPSEAALRWFNLKDIPASERILQGVVVNNFAYSPDGRRLAFFGRETATSGGVVYILDLDTGQIHSLLELSGGGSLVWSPDGTQLALIGSFATIFSQEILVLNVQNGAIDFQRPADFIDQNPDQSTWPTADWDVILPVLNGGLDACSAPS